MKDLQPSQLQAVSGGNNEGLMDWLREMQRELDRGYRDDTGFPVF